MASPAKKVLTWLVCDLTQGNKPKVSAFISYAKKLFLNSLQSRCFIIQDIHAIKIIHTLLTDSYVWNSHRNTYILVRWQFKEQMYTVKSKHICILRFYKSSVMHSHLFVYIPFLRRAQHSPKSIWLEASCSHVSGSGNHPRCVYSISPHWLSYLLYWTLSYLQIYHFFCKFLKFVYISYWVLNILARSIN